MISGKSTQLPAFILEHNLSQGKHCKIYCTEPRRISAISLAQRVSQEMGEPPGAVGTLGSIVGYSIRLESNTSRTTRLAYVTNGIALRMLESGSGPGGRGTAFDEITVRLLYTTATFKTNSCRFAHTQLNRRYGTLIAG